MASLRRKLICLDAIGRYEAFRKVALDIVAPALGRLPESAAARGEEGHAVSGLKLDFGFLVDARLFAVLARDKGEIDRAVAAAMQPPRRIGQPFQIDVGFALLQ